MRILHGDIGNIVQISAEDFNLVDFNLTIDDKYTLYFRGYEQIDIYIDPIIEETVKNILDELVELVAFRSDRQDAPHLINLISCD
jgi:hypothetical protein